MFIGDNRLFVLNCCWIFFQKEREEKQQEGKPDEDGWVTVTRKGKNPSFTRSEANEIKVRAQLKRKQEKQKVNIAIPKRFQLLKFVVWNC